VFRARALSASSLFYFSRASRNRQQQGGASAPLRLSDKNDAVLCEQVLFEALRTLARNEGVRMLMCESGTRNPRAHVFIQRLGFAPVSSVFAMEVP
jgi:GNAT superfamily N-acetyltransferase